MKKGLYFSFELKSCIAFIFSVLTIFSLGGVIYYGTAETPASASVKSFQAEVIIIDAGHGGIDSGTQSASGVLEKDINLQISLKLGSMLELMGYKVVQTRKESDLPYPESCVTVREKKVWDINRRLDIINKEENPIVLSIHQNYFTQSKYYGAQVFYSRNNPDSVILAKKIQSCVKNRLQSENNRSVKACGSEIYLLDNCSSVAVMVECGFLSNENEAKLLSDETYQSRLALAVCEGLDEYLREKENI